MKKILIIGGGAMGSAFSIPCIENDNRVVITVSALIGSLFILSGDLLARTIMLPNEIRLGVITSFVGAPYFIFLLIKQRKTYIER